MSDINDQQPSGDARGSTPEPSIPKYMPNSPYGGLTSLVRERSGSFNEKFNNSSGQPIDPNSFSTFNTGTQVKPEADLPERYESFVLADGETKVEIEHETRVPNAAVFTLNKEDHTLGNLLKDKLHRADHVLFAGYQVPHPLFAVVKLRIQTDGDVTPKQALLQACRDLVNELAMLDQDLTKEVELKKIAGAGSGAQ